MKVGHYDTKKLPLHGNTNRCVAAGMVMWHSTIASSSVQDDECGHADLLQELRCAPGRPCTQTIPPTPDMQFIRTPDGPGR